MPRARKGERILGPYWSEQHHGWLICLIGADRKRTSRVLPTEQEARKVRAKLEAELAIKNARSIEEVIDDYEAYMRDEKRLKMGTVTETVRRLRRFFLDRDLPLNKLTPRLGETYYAAARRARTRKGALVSVDTHRGMLIHAKTFLTWCVDQKLIAANPLVAVKGVGKKRKGKPQLRIDEARKWLEVAQREADKCQRGSDGAVAAMMALLLGLRATEVTRRLVRDVDDDCTLLWIPDSKTEAGRRNHEIPDMLRPHVQRLTANALPTAYLFARKDGTPHLRSWIRSSVRRICRMAGVPFVSAHSMRGLNSTILLSLRFRTAEEVAAALGQASPDVTMEHYADRDAVAKARQREALKVLVGGKR